MRSKNVLLWGAPHSLPRGEDYMVSYKRSGENFGNILIGNGVTTTLNGCRFLDRDTFTTPEEVNDHCDHIVIPAANFLWKSFDFGYMADFLERCTCPITMVGLGAQTNDRSKVSEIHPNTLRLVRMISERSPSIGVRGYYTAEVLAANGILNLEVLGCPSLYTQLAPPNTLPKWDASQLKSLSVNFSRRVADHSFDRLLLQNLENALFKISLANDLTFVAQDEIEELALSDGASSLDIDARRQITSYFSQSPDNDVLMYFQNNTRFFCNVEEWGSYIKTKSGSIGSRLHGNLIALTNGIPSLTIVHDSRTLEMCALTGAPYVHIKDCADHGVLEGYLLDQLANVDFSLFNRNMKTLFKRYQDFFEKHNLETNIQI